MYAFFFFYSSGKVRNCHCQIVQASLGEINPQPKTGPASQPELGMDYMFEQIWEFY